MTEWNDTLTGDYLWTNMFVAEVFPTAMTPSSWSVWQDYFDMLSMGDIPTIGRIASCPYVNYSLMYSFLLKIMRRPDRVRGLIKDSVGLPPPGVEIPPFPVSWRTVLLQVLPHEARNEVKKAGLRKRAPEFLAQVRERCQELEGQIERSSAGDLITLWTEEIRPLWRQIHPLQDKMNEELNQLLRNLKARLTELRGSDEATELLTTISSAGQLASLGLLVGRSRLRSGELSPEEYRQRYGHRGPYENELAEPRAYEDPDWLARQLAEYDESPRHVAQMLEGRDSEFDAVRRKIAGDLSPKDAREVKQKITAVLEASTLREATRAELTRLVAVIRALFLRGGALSGLGDGVFFLTVDEFVAVLAGDPSPAAGIAERRQVYERYRSLPRLPVWIRGRFDPFRWAADPDRRQDVFDAHVPSGAFAAPDDPVVRGQPGSAGRVEGLVRRIDSPEEGGQLQAGDILVTRTTNVGWTPLFPRAAAVVTDIGGSLSHAAIVARELGIPSVVGCGDATIRLKTGDRVRVDGGRGTIEILGR